MDIFECSQNSSEGYFQPIISNASQNNKISIHLHKQSSLLKQNQKNEQYNTSQINKLSQHSHNHIDNKLELEDLNDQSSVKILNNKYGQNQQVIQQQQSYQTFKSFNSSQNQYHSSTITPSDFRVPTPTEQIHLNIEQSSINMNSKHILSSSQYNIGNEIVKESFNIINKSSVRSIDRQGNNVFYQQKRKQKSVEINDQKQCSCLVEENHLCNSYQGQDKELKIKNEKERLKEYDQNLNCSNKQQKNVLKTQFNNFLYKCNNNTDPTNKEEQYLNQQQFQISQNTQNINKSLNASFLNETMGYAYSEDAMQLKIVNEILNYDDQKFDFTISSSNNCTGQQQFLNTDLVDIGSRLDNCTMKDLFNTTKDKCDISNIIANIELTDQNKKLIDELNIEEKIETLQQTKSHQQQLSSCNESNTLTVKDRLKNIDDFRNKNFKPNHLIEILKARQKYQKQINKQLIKLESDREKQKQKEGDIIKQVDLDFQKDIELMNQGLKEISNLKQEVYCDMMALEENFHNKIINKKGFLFNQINRKPIDIYKIQQFTSIFLNFTQQKLQERKSLSKEELITKLVQRAELVAQMEDFEEIQEDLKQKFVLEAKYLLQQFEMKKELKSISNNQQSLMNQNKEQMTLTELLQTQIHEFNESITQKQKQIKDIQNKKHQQLRIFNDKMEVIQEQINKKSLSLGFISSESIFQQLFNKKHLILTKQALEKQIELVGQEEINLNENYQREIELIEQRTDLSHIHFSDSSIQDPQQSQIYPNHSSIFHQSLSDRLLDKSSPNHLISSLKQTISVYQKENNAQKHSDVSGQQKVKENYLIRSTMLRKWKDKAKVHINILDFQIRELNESINDDENHNICLNRSTISNLIHIIFDSVNIDYEEKDIDFLTDLYEQYFEALQMQKNLLSQSNKEEIDHINSLEEIEKKINELKEQKEQIRREIDHSEEAIQKNSNTLKMKEQELNQKKIIMEGILQQQADKAFQDYIEQQSDVFEGLQKTYGQKALQQIKLGHHKQFREIMKQNQEKRMQKFEEVQTCIEKVNKSIQYNIKYIDNQLSEDLNQILLEIEESNAKKIQLGIDYDTILEKEKEFTKQLDSLIKAKNIKESYEYTSYETYEKNKFLLQKDIEDCENDIQVIQNNINSSQIQNENSIQINEVFVNKNDQLMRNNLFHKSHQQSDEIIKFQNNQSICELKKQLDEYQMQKLTLESKLIEINFNINLTSSQEIEKQKRQLTTYISNMNLIQEDEFKQDKFRRNQEAGYILNENQSQIENQININDLHVSKNKKQNNVVLLEKNKNTCQNYIPELSNMDTHSEITIPLPDNMNSLFSQNKNQSKVDYTHKCTTDGINQMKARSKNLKSENLRYKDNQDHQLTVNSNQINNISDQAKQLLTECKETNTQEKENQNIQQLFLNASQKYQKAQQLLSQEYSEKDQSDHINKLCSSISSYTESYNQQQIQNQSLTASSNQSQNKQQPQKQAEHNLNDKQFYDSQNQYFKSKDQQVNNENEDVTKYQNTLNQKQQKILENSEFETMNIIESDIYKGNLLQINKQYENLGHTLKTITEEQMSTNRGYSARNNQMLQNNNQQFYNSQSNSIKFKPIFQQSNQQNETFSNLNSNNVNVCNLEKNCCQSTKNQSCNKIKDINQQTTSSKVNRYIYEEQMTQRERLNARRQQLLAQQSQTADFSNTQQHQTNQNLKQNIHNRCHSLLTNPKESSLLLHQNFKIKNFSGKYISKMSKNEKLQNQQQQNNGQLLNNCNLILQEQQFEVNLDQQYPSNELSKNKYFNCPLQQQENVCPNTCLPINSCKSNLPQKNITNFFSNTLNPSSMELNEKTIKDNSNQFYTPISNSQISFNSYLNSSLHKTKQMNKINKSIVLETQKLPNQCLLEYQLMNKKQSQEHSLIKQVVESPLPQNNQNINSCYNQQLKSTKQKICQNQDQDYQNQYLKENHLIQHNQQEQILNDKSNNFQVDNQSVLQLENLSAVQLDSLKIEQLTRNNNRRSKSEEMKNTANSFQTTAKINSGINNQLITPDMNQTRSQSQNRTQPEQSCKSQQQYLQHCQYQQQQYIYPKQYIFKLHLQSLQNKEAQLLIQIKELLEGGLILKKFSQQQSLKQHVFNPFTHEQIPPENCGYGVRYITLHKSLTKLEIRHPLKQGTIESTLNIDQILRYSIPNTTSELIKIQKNNEQHLQKDQKSNLLYKNISTNFQKIEQIQFYAFCIIMEKGGRIELISQDYKSFTMWTQGIQQLIKYKKILPHLKNHIEQIQII